MMATVLPTAATPADRLLARFDRRQLAGFIEIAIGLLDLADGDPDIEPNGDELEPDGTESDVGWTEYHTRGRHKLDATGAEPHRGPGGAIVHEDDEQDDHAEDDDPGEDGDADACNAGEDRGTDGGGSAEFDRSGHAAVAIGEGDEAEAGHCLHFGHDQTRPISEVEAFHDLNDVPLIRVPLPGNDE